MNKRINYIDIAKCFAIFFIVLGHIITYSTHCDQTIYKVICGFHVVLFFILSGYTFSTNDNYIKFSINKFKRIMIPYFVWALLFLVPYMFFGKDIANTNGVEANFTLDKMLFNILYGNGNIQALKQNTALWFLPALFSMEMIYYWLIKFTNNKKHYIKILSLALLFIIAIVYNSYITFVFPWGINTVIELGIFFYIGYLFRQYDLLNKKKIFNNISIVLLLGIGILISLTNIKVSAVNYRYGNLVLYIISGLSLSVVIMYISKLINKNKILEFIGKNTMSILIFHKLPIILFQTRIKFLSNMLKDSNIFLELGIGIIVSIISILLSIIIMNILTFLKRKINGLFLKRREKN